LRSRGAVAALFLLAVVGGCRELHGPGEPADTEIYPPLVGQVLDEEGEPLAEAEVRVRYEQPVWREKELDLRVMTNEQGFFSIRVAPDTFRVDIEPPRWSPLPPWTENGVVFDPLSARVFRFVGHQVRGRLDLGALPDSLWDVSSGWRVELSYLHRWPGGGSSTLTNGTNSITDPEEGAARSPSAPSR
jgi:hypothetical protein